jgi:hypothetical protein
MTRHQRFAIPAVVASVGLAVLTACSAAPTSPSGRISLSPAAVRTPHRPTSQPLPNAVFLFQNPRTQVPPDTMWYVTDSKGTVLHSFESEALDATFEPISDALNYIGNSTAILASSVGRSLWGVVQADGTATPVAPSLTPLLKQIGFPGTFLIAPATLFTVLQFANPENPFKFYELNLTSGAVLASASLVPLNRSGTVLFEPQNIDPTAHLLSFLIANTTFRDVKIPGLSVVTLDYATDAMSVHALGSAIARDILPPDLGTPQYETTAYVSADGSVLIYQSATTATTTILDVPTGHAITLAPSLNLSFIPGQNSVFFSPGDRYAALIGTSPAGDTGLFFVIDTTSGALIRNIGASVAQNAYVNDLGWAGPAQLVYSTDTTNQLATEVTHLEDVVAGTTTTFRSALGQFVAVLP